MPILKFPEFRQVYKYDCGASALQSVLVYYGFDVREKDIMDLAGTSAHDGTPIKGFKKVAKHYGLKSKVRKLTIENVKKYIAKRVPVIIDLEAWSEKKKVDWEDDWQDGHYVVAIGYDRDKFYFEDPSSVHRTFLTFVELQKRWHDQDPKTKKKLVNIGIIISGRKPDYHPERAEHMD